MKEHHQAYAALCLTAGEFGAGLWMLFHDGHILALYLAFTYLSRETTGGKHYHAIVMAWLGKLHRDRQCEKACRALADSAPTRRLTNPFGGKHRGKVSA